MPWVIVKGITRAIPLVIISERVVVKPVVRSGMRAKIGKSPGDSTARAMVDFIRPVYVKNPTRGHLRNRHVVEVGRSSQSIVVAQAVAIPIIV